MTENQQLAMLIDFRKRLLRAMEQSDKNLGDDVARMPEKHHIGAGIPMFEILTPSAWEWRNSGVALALTPLADLVDDITAIIDALSAPKDNGGV